MYNETFTKSVHWTAVYTGWMLYLYEWELRRPNAVVQTFTFEDDRENSEDEGATDSRVESPPIVAHSKVARCYLNAEQHT